MKKIIFSVVLRVGGSESVRFHGAVSLVQVWDIARNTSEITSVLNKKTTPIKSQSYTQGLIADWSWDSFQPGPGMKKVSPSTRGQTICSIGQELATDGSTCVDRKTGNQDLGVTEMCCCNWLGVWIVQYIR